MSAYVISEFRVLDQDLIGNYRDAAVSSAHKYGGKFLVRATALELIEGPRDQDKLFTIIEFPSMAKAREWYHSPEYAEAFKYRYAALDRTMVFLEGVAEG